MRATNGVSGPSWDILAGKYRVGYIDVPIWTGGASFDVRTSDCADWSSTAGFGTSKNASSTRGAAFAQQTCAAPQHVLCFAGQVFMAKPKH